MAYSKQTWVNNNKDSKLNGPRMTHIEEGIFTADQLAESANTIASEALIAANNAVEIADAKQDELTAGDNITILNNIISATGGGLEFDDLALYTKYGVFRINGEAYNVEDEGSEIVLSTGESYELSGYLKGGHIFIKSNTPDEEAQCTQLIFNGVYIKSDSPRVIYFNQTKKKVAIKLSDDTQNFIEAGNYIEQPSEAEGAIQAEGNMLITSGKNSYLFVKSTNTVTDNDCRQHAIKASRLYLSGVGSIDVEAYHDGFHGGKLLRVDSGNYKVLHAEADGFEAKYLQIFGGNIEVVNCYADAISSKENKGVVAGYDVKFNFGESVTSKFNNIDILETVPEIEGITPVTLSDYFGSPVLKEGYVEGMTDEQIAELNDLTLNTENNEYETTNTAIYIKGFIENPIVVKTKSTDIYFDKACVNVSDFDYAIKYDNTSKKLAIKPRVDDEGDDYVDLSLIIYSGNDCAIKSNKNCTLQGDNALIVKSSNNLIDASEIVLRCDDGVKILDAKNSNSPATSLFIGGNKDQEEKFNVGSLSANFVLEAKHNESKSASDDAKVKIINGQVGYITAKALFGSEIVNNIDIQTTKYETNIVIQKDKLDYLLERLYLLENI